MQGWHPDKKHAGKKTKIEITHFFVKMHGNCVSLRTVMIKVKLSPMIIIGLNC